MKMINFKDSGNSLKIIVVVLCTPCKTNQGEFGLQKRIQRERRNALLEISNGVLIIRKTKLHDARPPLT